MKNKIGVLLPQSSAYPQIGKSFTNGLRLALDGIDFDLSIESIGLGSDPKQIINSFQKLTIQENVKLTTGLIGHYGFNELAEFVSQNEEILIAADLGSSLAIKPPNGIFQNSLGLQDSLIKLVDYFSRKNVKNLATSSCYYEAGYGFVKALEIGINNQKTTQFAGHYITPHKPRENESEIMAMTLESVKPDAVIAYHNGIFAKEHVEFLSQNNAQDTYPIYTLPFSSEDKLIENSPEIFKSIKSVSSWQMELDNPENKTFISTYEQTFGKSPDYFALLGYENGLIIKNALTQNNQPLLKSVEETNIKGPRGTINFDNSFRKTNFPHYIWSQELSENKKVLRKPQETLNEDALKVLETLSEEESTNQGWFNAYLCH